MNPFDDEDYPNKKSLLSRPELAYTQNSYDISDDESEATETVSRASSPSRRYSPAVSFNRRSQASDVSSYGTKGFNTSAAASKFIRAAAVTPAPILGESKKASLRLGESEYSDDKFGQSKLYQSKYDQSNFDQSKFDQSEFVQSAFDHSKFDQSKFDQSAFDQSKFKASEYTDYSPSKFSPSKYSPSKYSPSKYSPSKFSASFDNPYPQSPTRSDWAKLESPQRAKHASVILEDYNGNSGASIASSGSTISYHGSIPKTTNSGASFGSSLGYSLDESIDEKGFSSSFEKSNLDKINALNNTTLSASQAISLDKNMHLPLSHQPRRNRALRKEFKLERGNLVLENPVPTKLASFLPRRDDDEFLFMRYTACTCDPDDFIKNGFTLRSAKYGRETEIVICITMYNEDEISFARTMHAVMENISKLCARRRSKVWGDEGWKKVQVIIVSDGRAKISPGVLEILAAMGVYQDGIAKSYVNSKAVKAHLFEYTTQVAIDTDLKFQGAEKGMVPVQILFCLKEKNQKKINSHRWLFNAFCGVLDPNVCVLLDVGTRPDKDAVYHLWKAFDNDSNVAGAAGEIIAMKENKGLNLLNPLVASQNFEYKMSNILDKPLESVFGYISVLPGALSAYRYCALKNHPDGTGPLDSYFKGETLSGATRDVFSANMYLAEDRILCWELVAKKSEKWVLKYVKQAKGETDVPESLPEFISQRRRWLNGALFAALYSQIHFRQVWKTDHSFVRKTFLHFEFLYQFVQLLFSFFSLGNFYLAFYFLAGSLANTNAIPHNGGYWVFTILNYFCLCDLTSIFIISMGNRPQGAKHLYFASMIILTVCALYSVACGFYFVAKTLKDQHSDPASSETFRNIVVSLLSTYGLYAFTSVMYLDPWHIITCSFQYFLMLPSYTCTLQIYAFCNTHDVSWGTKGENKPTADLGRAIIKTDQSGHEVVEVEIPSEQLDIDSGYEEILFNLRSRRQTPRGIKSLADKEVPEEDYYRDIRTRVVLFWLLSNMLLVMIVTQVYSIKDTNSNKYLAFILWSVACLAAFRACGSMMYLLHLCIRWAVESKHKLDDGGYTFSVPKPKVNFSFGSG